MTWSLSYICTTGSYLEEGNTPVMVANDKLLFFCSHRQIESFIWPLDLENGH